MIFSTINFNKGKEERVFKKQVENKLQFWSVLGPCIIILTLLISLIKFSPESFYLPLAIVVGIPSCWVWKLRGMLFSITVLLLLLFLSFSGIAVEERLWHFGVAVATALAFIVATLSSEEVEALVQKMQARSKSRLDHLLRLDEKLKLVNEEMLQYKEKTTQDLECSQKTTNQYKSEMESFHQASRFMQKEMNSSIEDRQKLLEELFQKKECLIHCQRELAEEREKIVELTKQSQFNQSDREKSYIKKIEEFQSDFDEGESLLREVQREKDDLKKSLSEKERELENLYEGKQKEFNKLSKEGEKDLREALSLAEQHEELVLTLEGKLVHVQENAAKLERQLQKQKEIFHELQGNSRKREAFLRKEIEDRDYQLYMQVRRQAESQKEMFIYQKVLKDFKGSHGSLEGKLYASENKLRKIQSVIGKNRELWDKLNTIRTEKFQLFLDKNFLNLKLDKLQKRVKKKEVVNIFKEEKTFEKECQKGCYNRNTELLYKQLKKQFEQKNDVLHLTRKELFNLEGELFYIKRELEMKSLEKNEESESLLKTIQSLNEENQLFEEEILMLNDLVSSLLPLSTP